MLNIWAPCSSCAWGGRTAERQLRLQEDLWDKRWPGALVALLGFLLRFSVSHLPFVHPIELPAHR